MPLVVDAVSHRFQPQGAPVLSAVSLTATPGRMLAVTGPSGSGKSTLLSVIGLLINPMEGAVSWEGTALATGRARAAARAELFGWITQNTNVLGARTVLDNAAIALLGNGFRRRDARLRARSALAAVGLAHREDMPARDLSGGETQRLAVARAMLGGKPVIIADEPTGQLDRANTEMVVQTLRTAADNGAAVIAATHDSNVAQACDDWLELEDGRAAWRL